MRRVVGDNKGASFKLRCGGSHDKQLSYGALNFPRNSERLFELAEMSSTL